MINPSFLNDMSWEMAQVYGAVTDKLLINLASYFPFIDKSDEVLGMFQYQAQMLAKMGQVHRESMEIIAQHLKGADKALAEILSEAIRQAIEPIDPVLKKAAEKGLLVGQGMLPPEVSPSMTQAFKAYYTQSADKLNLVNTVMLESTDEAYRRAVVDVTAKLAQTQRILNESTGLVMSGADSYNTAVREAVQRMVENGLTGFIDHGGHHWSPEAYTAMDIRTTVANTARAAVWEREEQYGNDLYQVSYHDGARPLCYPWQGKVISRTDNARYVEDDEGNTIRVYAQSETSYGEAAGLFGINCGHYPIPFVPGFSRIREPKQDEEQNAKQYEEVQEQRRLERELRYQRRDLEVLKAQGASDAEIRAQEMKVRQASDRIDDYCDETGLTRRRSREYTPIKAEWPE